VQPPDRALRVLRDAYGAGHVSTATLESRAEWVLGGRVEDAVWDLPPSRPRGLATTALGWWRPAAPIRSLVAGETEWRLSDRGRWVLGRGSACDLVLGDDDAVSRRHAEIAVRAGLCLVRDLDSCNGTLLNGRPVRRARLRRGDVLLVGETEIRVR
jgi:FHA domain-containing protein